MIGAGPGAPLLLLNRFRGTMDHWDPMLIDRIATKRTVIMFDQPGFDASLWQVATKPVNDDQDFLFLLFEPTATSRSAGQAYLSRLNARKDAFVKHVEPAAWQAQLKAAIAVGSENTSLLPRLGEVPHPVLVANGRHDVMVPTYASFAMAQRLPNARLVVYPDSGHGFLFQYPEEFAHEVLRFVEQR
ncbi:alpha/beta fold hydrolase [Variovorax sp. DT-64]|uniref:alpha/beta fold hydrolase n=1 Tax=Variovorax sp. DT-64 TaxID=3396160 RepID=UPI003F193234